MSARNVLFLIILAFVFTTLLLVYNGFYKPTSVGSVAMPSVQEGH